MEKAVFCPVNISPCLGKVLDTYSMVSKSLSKDSSSKISMNVQCLKKNTPMCLSAKSPALTEGNTKLQERRGY